MNTNTKGQIAQSKAELRAVTLGYMPSKPLFDARYDLILDDLNGNLIRTQIKYVGSLKDGSVAVVSLDYANRKGEVKKYLSSEVDALVVYIHEIDELCFFPKDVFVGKLKLHIRLKEPKIACPLTTMATDYIWDKMVS